VGLRGDVGRDLLAKKKSKSIGELERKDASGAKVKASMVDEYQKWSVSATVENAAARLRQDQHSLDFTLTFTFTPRATYCTSSQCNTFCTSPQDVCFALLGKSMPSGKSYRTHLNTLANCRHLARSSYLAAAANGFQILSEVMRAT
jgi:hypothetical protein